MPTTIDWMISVGGAESAFPEALGVKISGIKLRDQSTGSASLARVAQFDEATDIFTYGTTVAIARCRVNRDANGDVLSIISRTVFKGKIVTNPRSADPTQEVQDIEILDVWDELERTIYQESWNIGPDQEENPRSPVYMPRAILGINPTGGNITTGTQLGLFVQYAQDQAGVGVQMGSAPAGISLWPSGISNMTVAELIRNTMKYHPNWVTQFDYTTTPVTINFKDTATADALSYALDGSSDVDGFSVREVSERVPECVAITYETTSRVGDTNHRDVVQDIYPLGGNPKSPGSLSVTINLEGGSAVTMKQPIETKTMPVDLVAAKAWIIGKFPSLAAFPADFFTVTYFERILIPDGDQPDPPVNEEQEREEVLTVDELPRELIRGTIADFMKKKARKVEVRFRLKASAERLENIFANPGGADDLLHDKMPFWEQKLVVTCTNATTKVYKGTSSYTPAENAPTGIAQAIYDALNQTQYEGYVSLVYDEIPDEIYAGKMINLTAGRAEWASMQAMVTEVSYDTGNSRVNISFGPPSFLSPGDWVELQRALRGRQPTWVNNREGDEPTDDGPQISGGYDTPDTETLAAGGLSIKHIKGIRGTTVTIDELQATVGMPDAYHGNVMYFNQPDPMVEGEWVPLDNPDVPEDSGMTNVLKHPGGEAIPEWVQVPVENLAVVLLFPFKTTDGGIVEAAQTYNVAAGKAAGVSIAAGTMTVPDGHVIYVEIERNPSSRAVVGASRTSGASMPASTSTYQYIEIAAVNAGAVVQRRFEDIRAEELIIQSAGELKMLTIFDTTNLYDLPY